MKAARPSKWSRGEISSVSVGYRVEPSDWEITDAKGDKVDPERAKWNDDLTFTARKWELLEASLVAVAADSQAVMRHVDSAFMVATRREDVRARMEARHAMVTGRHMLATEYWQRAVSRAERSIFGMQRRQSGLVHYG
jgi:hypothetical protein